ncbi:hypothetical protein ANN_27292 [Periplaneta americana]|uniref:Uncharacterized protein n=1 Tax=Periplaneta americana TaxID=6978 RepID=A0ABQ8RXL6_PERAM|nr:hypothetical protein ANN_27292 [Periplaneta americana]
MLPYEMFARTDLGDLAHQQAPASSAMVSERFEHSLTLQSNVQEDRRMQYCGWLPNMVQEDEAFVGNVVCSDEEQFKSNGNFNRHSCTMKE